MARVVVLLRVLPADVEVDVEALREKIQVAITKLGKGFALQSYKVEPIAFGVEGVGEVEVEVVSRVS